MGFDSDGGDWGSELEMVAWVGGEGGSLWPEEEWSPQLGELLNDRAHGFTPTLRRETLRPPGVWIAERSALLASGEAN